MTEGLKRKAYTIDGSLIADAINVVNDFRKQFGLSALEDLPKGTPGDATNCIFAKAFNFDCVVAPHGHLDVNGKDMFGGSIIFNKHEGKKAKALAKILGTQVSANEYNYVVELPTYIARIARSFDNRYLPQYIED